MIIYTLYLMLPFIVYIFYTAILFPMLPQSSFYSNEYLAHDSKEGTEPHAYVV